MRRLLFAWWTMCAVLALDPHHAVAQISGGSHFSPLDQITTANVGQLTRILSFPIAHPGGYSGTPATDGNLLFLATPFPHTIFALNLVESDSKVRWQYSPTADSRASGLACCDATTGGVTLAGERIYVATLDGHVLTLQAATGALDWDTPLGDFGSGETIGEAPVVADGKVYIGNSGDEFGARGWIAALDAATGSLQWKRYTTGPDIDVGVDPSDSPDQGVTTWPPGAWQHGGGGLAGGLLVDAGNGLLVHATGHPAPWDADVRPGANRWTAGLFGRDAANGRARWFQPINPHDRYAFGAAGSTIAADLPWQDSSRAVLLHADANGRVYVLDRNSGDVLSAAAFVTTNAKPVSVNSTTRDICPGWPGATGGTAVAAFSPQTRLLYIPTRRLCMDMELRQASFMQGLPFTGANLRMKSPHGTNRGALIAWDVSAGKPAWTIDEDFPVESGTLATAGGLVFYGTLDGLFKAVDARSGQVLWQFHASSGIIGRPITFRRADGRQCVAVVAGMGGIAGQVARDGIDIRDATAAHGYANALRDLKPSQDAGGTLYVFALP